MYVCVHVYMGWVETANYIVPTVILKSIKIPMLHRF